VGCLCGAYKRTKTGFASKNGKHGKRGLLVSRTKGSTAVYLLAKVNPVYLQRGRLRFAFKDKTGLLSKRAKPSCFQREQNRVAFKESTEANPSLACKEANPGLLSTRATQLCFQNSGARQDGNNQVLLCRRQNPIAYEEVKQVYFQREQIPVWLAKRQIWFAFNQGKSACFQNSVCSPRRQ